MVVNFSIQRRFKRPIGVIPLYIGQKRKFFSKELNLDFHLSRNGEIVEKDSVKDSEVTLASVSLKKKLLHRGYFGEITLESGRGGVILSPGVNGIRVDFLHEMFSIPTFEITRDGGNFLKTKVLSISVETKRHYQKIRDNRVCVSADEALSELGKVLGVVIYLTIFDEFLEKGNC